VRGDLQEHHARRPRGGVHRARDRCRPRRAVVAGQPRCAGRAAAGGGAGCGGAPAAGAGAGEHAEVRGGRAAVRVRHVLGRRGHGLRLAGRRSRHPGAGVRLSRGGGAVHGVLPAHGAGSRAMSWLRKLLAELWGLFVDDGRYALAIVVWLLLAWLALPLLGLDGGWNALVFAAGLLAILAESVL